MRRRTLTDGASKIYSLDECIWVEIASQNILNFLNESSIKNQIYGVAVLTQYSIMGSEFLGDITYLQFSNGYKYINTYGNSSNPNVRYLQDNNNNNITTNMSTIPVGKIYSYVSNDEKVIIAHHAARGFTTSYKTFTSEVPFSITFVEDPETMLWVLVPYDVISYMDKFKDMEWVAVTSSLVNAINNTNQSIVYGLRGFDYKPSVSTAIDRKIYLLNGAYLREYREVGINHVYMYLKNTDISNVFTYGAPILDYKRYYSFNGGNPIQKESSQDEAYSSATRMLHMFVCNGTKITSSDFPSAENIHVLILVPRYFLDL